MCNVDICWKALGSPDLVPSNTLLTSFDGRSFCLHGILLTVEIKLAEKVFFVEFEVVDGHLDYKLLLGRIWTYAMCVIPSYVLRVLVFPHKGKLVTVDQLTYTRKAHLDTTESTVPLIYHSRMANESLGVGMYTSLMGTFDIPTPINYLGSTSVGKSSSMVVERTDPWVLPS